MAKYIHTHIQSTREKIRWRRHFVHSCATHEAPNHSSDFRFHSKLYSYTKCWNVILLGCFLYHLCAGRQIFSDFWFFKFFNFFQFTFIFIFILIFIFSKNEKRRGEISFNQITSIKRDPEKRDHPQKTLFSGSRTAPQRISKPRVMNIFSTSRVLEPLIGPAEGVRLSLTSGPNQ